MCKSRAVTYPVWLSQVTPLHSQQSEPSFQDSRRFDESMRPSLNFIRANSWEGRQSDWQCSRATHGLVEPKQNEMSSTRWLRLGKRSISLDLARGSSTTKKSAFAFYSFIFLHERDIEGLHGHHLDDALVYLINTRLFITVFSKSCTDFFKKNLWKKKTIG